MSDFKLLIKVSVDSERIDKYVAAASDFSRSDVQKLIKGNAVFVDSVCVRKANFIVRLGQEILITEVINKEINADPEKIDINIVYEDEHLVVINKKSGMVVHPAPGHHSGTLVNALLYHFKDLSNINGKVRPGIVHRIDKDTSGLLIVAKSNEAHQKLAQDLKDHKIKRTYLAWVDGIIENDVTHIKLPIGRDVKHRKKMSVTKVNSKDAITHVYVQKVVGKKTLIKCELETGRTHQIRVHLAHIKKPIWGDPMYGKKLDDFGQRLHAYKLEFKHPITNKNMVFEVDPPEEFNN